MLGMIQANNPTSILGIIILMLGAQAEEKGKARHSA